MMNLVRLKPTRPTGLPPDSSQPYHETSGFPMESKGIRLDSSQQYWTTLSSMSLPVVGNSASGSKCGAIAWKHSELPFTSNCISSQLTSFDVPSRFFIWPCMPGLRVLFTSTSSRAWNLSQSVSLMFSLCLIDHYHQPTHTKLKNYQVLTHCCSRHVNRVF